MVGGCWGSTAQTDSIWSMTLEMGVGRALGSLLGGFMGLFGGIHGCVPRFVIWGNFVVIYRFGLRVLQPIAPNGFCSEVRD